MSLSNTEIWQKVIELQGKTLYTFIENERNTIIQVEDTNSSSDRVIILDRNTYPVKEDIIAAYNLLTISGKLKRIPDLAWLAQPGKLVSSIVFRIIGEISKDYIQIDLSRKIPILVLRDLSQTFKY